MSGKFPQISKADPRGPSAPEPSACVIVSTFNRVDALKLCLEHLERQTCAAFEVVLVDDGSTDATPTFIQRYVVSTPLKIRSVRQPNSGPARARNLGVSLTAAPIAIFLGDDILCSPTLIETHLDFHHRHPDPKCAGLGLTVWSESLQTVTPFMRWMDESGSQFAYRDLLRGVPPDWRHFYTSNLSLKTEHLRRNPFNERFAGKVWMMEDMELGYRLQRLQALQLVFLPSAIAEHLHPTDFGKACRRAYAAGLSARLFDELWPDRPKVGHGVVHRALRDFLCWNPWLLAPATRLVGAMTNFWCPNPFLQPIFAFHTALARRRGW